MSEKSSIFDSIRVKPSKKEEAAKQDERVCQWEGCEAKGIYKAPRGRDREGEYVYFCAQHVREYNKNYNYFSGMDDDSVATYQKASSTGHRPTWEVSSNSWGSRQRTASGGIPGSKPWLHRNKAGQGANPNGASPEARRQRKLKRLEKQSLEKLALPDNANSKEIKSKYKQLVKIHHPDANGGDRSSEDRLREIIQAYNFLKSAGFTD